MSSRGQADWNSPSDPEYDAASDPDIPIVPHPTSKLPRDKKKQAKVSRATGTTPFPPRQPLRTGPPGPTGNNPVPCTIRRYLRDNPHLSLWFKLSQSLSKNPIRYKPVFLPITAESTHTITLGDGKVLRKNRLALGPTPQPKPTSLPESPSDSDVEVVSQPPRVTYGPPLPPTSSPPLDSLPDALDAALNSALETTSAVPATAQPDHLETILQSAPDPPVVPVKPYGPQQDLPWDAELPIRRAAARSWLASHPNLSFPTLVLTQDSFDCPNLAVSRCP